jgi:glyoxylase-like metal-dependent hydrolase (beta-lactamase superfamily II)
MATHSLEVTAITRRQLFRSAVAVAVGFLPARPVEAQGTVEAAAARRAQIGATPIATTMLTDRLSLLSGPGGNVLLYTGTDGKVIVDGFVQPAWTALKRIVDGTGAAPLRSMIDTHWHFDHADNNANARAAGAEIVAHAKTALRLSETHELLGMRILPSPQAARPTRRFATTHALSAANERIELAAFPPAHTDTDISVHFTRANVLHLGDTYFNGMYPFFDIATGGTINGMIAAATARLQTADTRTRIVPGHGPIGDRATLTRYRDMLVTVRDRVQKLKQSGRTAAETVAATPTKEFDPAWGQGLLTPDAFVGLVYASL